jgi:hypothetical protein
MTKYVGHYQCNCGEGYGLEQDLDACVARGHKPAPPVHSALLPVVADTMYFLATGLRLDLTGHGPWELTGSDPVAGRDMTTTHEGPLDPTARRLLHDAYPNVITWYASPASVDETYPDTIRGAQRICQLLGVEMRTALAILAIAADDVLGHKFVYGQWEVTGDDDDQSFRIRSVKPGGLTRAQLPESFEAFAAQFIAAFAAPLTHVPMACTVCGKPVREYARGQWMHTMSEDRRNCTLRDGPVKARVDA